MKTLVDKFHDSCDFCERYAESQTTFMDYLYTITGEFERAILWSTYPELSLKEVDQIEELLLEDKSAGEILETMGLEDRDELMKENAEILASFRRDQWDNFVRDKILDCYGGEGLSYWYYEMKRLADSIMIGKEELDKESLQSLINCRRVIYSE